MQHLFFISQYTERALNIFAVIKIKQMLLENKYKKVVLVWPLCCYSYTVNDNLFKINHLVHLIQNLENSYSSLF